MAVKTASKISYATVSRSLTFQDFVELARGPYNRTLNTLEAWRDARMIAQRFPGFGDPPSGEDDEDADIGQHIEDMRPAARFADLPLNPRHRALLIVLYLVQQSTATSKWERGQPAPPLFIRYRTLNDLPGLSRKDGVILDYVDRWICARHLGGMPLEVVQMLSQQRYGQLVAAYFKAVHYHEHANKPLELFLQQSSRKPLALTLLSGVLACLTLTISAMAILILTGHGLPVDTLQPTTQRLAWGAAAVGTVLLGIAGRAVLKRSAR